MPSQRIFLSLVSAEFRPYRELLADDIRRAQVEVKTQESFGTLGRTTLEKLDDYLGQCDAVIHLVGDSTGSIPEQAAVEALLDRHPTFLDFAAEKLGMTRADLDTCSYTQWEAYLAIFLDKRLHIYRADDNAPRQSGFTTDPAHQKLQQAHYKRIENLGRDRDVVLDHERLSSFVLADLHDILPPRDPDLKPHALRLRHAARQLIGREPWLKKLDAAWTDPHTHVAVFRAWGGIGKTALVAAWMAEMEHKGWRGADQVFDWSFYSQGTKNDAGVSADLFIAEALAHFGDPDPQAGSPTDRGERLAHLVAKQKTLLVLDGIEPLQHPPGPVAGNLTDPALHALVSTLAAGNPGLCIITTREHLVEFEARQTVTEWNLDQLSDHAGAALLHHHGATRSGATEIGSDDPALLATSRDYNGHALTLTLIGKYLSLACQHDIQQRDTFHLSEADPEWITTPEPDSPYGHAFKVISVYENWFQGAPDNDRSAAEQQSCDTQLAALRLLGLFNRPATAACLEALRQDPPIENLTEPLVDLPPKDWTIALSRLEENALIKRDPPDDPAPSIDAHPLVREYFATKLKFDHPESFKQAHSRLFDHLCQTTEHHPDTLAGLQPLYQAITHGCLADRHQQASDDVFYLRIRRGNKAFSQRILGAIGADLAAIASFFDQPWSIISSNLSAPDQGWFLNAAAFSLRAQGRLTEALEPMRVGLQQAIDLEHWENAAVATRNLTELQLTRGILTEVPHEAERSIDFADRSGDPFQRIFSLTTAADSLHFMGERKAAATRFSDAERMQAEHQPQRPILYGLDGFQYNDFLLTPAERAAWNSDPNTEAAAAIKNTRRRGKRILEWQRPDYPLLIIALNQLTLARVTLYDALLQPIPTPDNPHLQPALDTLRQANTLHNLPWALLTTAHHHAAVLNDHATAHNLLDEAEHIARRGPMPLHLADVHLHRARLFKDKAELKNARTLIEKHGYWRRKEELEDAEAASKNW